MSTTTLTSKGQLTLPKAVRDRFGLVSGDRFTVVGREDGVIELQPRRLGVDALVGLLAADVATERGRDPDQDVLAGVVEAVVQSLK